MTNAEDLIFDPHHHGDEVILDTTEEGKITVDFKQQSGKCEHHHLKLTAPSYTQMYELLRVFVPRDRRK